MSEDAVKYLPINKNPRWSRYGERLVMTQKQFQNSADALVGTIMETLESYNLPDAQINTVRRIAWAEIDKQFGRFIDE